MIRQIDVHDTNGTLVVFSTRQPDRLIVTAATRFPCSSSSSSTSGSGCDLSGYAYQPGPSSPARQRLRHSSAASLASRSASASLTSDPRQIDTSLGPSPSPWNV